MNDVLNPENRILDWQPNWDERNERFMVSGLDCFIAGSARANIQRTKSVFLDQGREGACTGFGTAHVLASSPKPRSDINNDAARTIYYEARRQDEWPGENYDGSSVNGAMKAARLQGFITEWRWCKSIAEIKHAVSYHGPLVIGVHWYSGMFQPDDQGFLNRTGDRVGGHALMLSGYKGDHFWLDNSWGLSWGLNGGAWIHALTLQQLMMERGEFACPKKIPA